MVARASRIRFFESQASRVVALGLLSFSLSLSASASTPNICLSRALSIVRSNGQEEPFKYPESLSELNPDVPHTLKNVPQYLTQKLGDEAYQLLLSPEVKILIVRGPGTHLNWEPAAQKLGEIKTLPNPFGAFTVGVNDQSPKTLVISNVTGSARETQVLSILKLANVKESRVQIQGTNESFLPIYQNAFNKIDKKADLVVFGFANTAFEAWMEKHPLDHAQPLLSQNKTYSTLKWTKPAVNEHELINMGVQVLELNDGKSVWFIDNEYGERAKDVVHALQATKIKKMIVFGTAGSLSPALKVGDIVAPQSFKTTHGVIFKSPFLSGIPHFGVAVDVQSPTLETRNWVNSQIKSGASLVDVEMTKIAEALRLSPMSSSGYLIISDEIHLPNSPDYSHWTETHRINTKKSLLPLLEQAMDSAGISNEAAPKRYFIQPYLELNRGTPGP